jgi:signal transduction histidine kinase
MSTEEADGSIATRRLQTLAYELTLAEARERKRIADVLHDEIGQLLAMAQFRLGELGHELPSGSQEAATVEEVRSLLHQAAQATRATTFELHPAVLKQLGLPSAIESMVFRMQRGSHMRIHLHCDEPDPPMPQAASLVLLRTVRELTLNAQKHARAANLWITLQQQADHLEVSVTDDGIGFDAGTVIGRLSPEGGFGLVSVEAQMQAIGGSMSIESVPGHGTEVLLSLPPVDPLRVDVHPSSIEFGL